MLGKVVGLLEPTQGAVTTVGISDELARHHESVSVPFARLNDLLWFSYLYPLRFAAKFVPPRVLYPLARLAQLRDGARRRIATQKMLAAGISASDAPRLARKFLENSGIRMLDDLVVSWPSFPEKLHCQGIHGLEHLEQAHSAGKGVILLSAHFCGIRVGKKYLAANGYPMLSVHDEFLVEKSLGRIGRRMLDPRRIEFLRSIIGDVVFVRDRDCTLKLLQRLRSGGLVNIHFDGRSGKKSANWPFLGRPRNFSIGPLDLVRLSGCSAVPMFCTGNASEFQIRFGPPIEIAYESEREEFVRANLPGFVSAIETQVREHPEEWEQWMTF